MRWSGHAWTVLPHVAARVRPPRLDGRPWKITIPDARHGTVDLRGVLTEVEGAAGIVVLVHGLGGGPTSPYLVRAAAVARERGLSSLRLSLRGADGSGEDIYHAGLASDLHAAIASPALARYHDVYLLGYSLGGHVALRLAAEDADPRLRGVAAVCAPLDLARGADAIDAPSAWVYRRNVLRGLVTSYAALAARRPVPHSLDRIRRVRSLREWDGLTVVPRFGFDSVAHYYTEASVASRLDALCVPALWLGSHNDPMVPPFTVEPALSRRRAGLEVRWTDRGGHVGFPAGLDLGLPGAPGRDAQVLAWLLSVGDAAARLRSAR